MATLLEDLLFLSTSMPVACRSLSPEKIHNCRRAKTHIGHIHSFYLMLNFICSQEWGWHVIEVYTKTGLGQYRLITQINGYIPFSRQRDIRTQAFTLDISTTTLESPVGRYRTTDAHSSRTACLDRTRHWRVQEDLVVATEFERTLEILIAVEGCFLKHSGAPAMLLYLHLVRISAIHSRGPLGDLHRHLLEVSRSLMCLTSGARDDDKMRHLH